MVEYLPSKYKALSSVSNTENKNARDRPSLNLKSSPGL
jgi:hypothetical protein